MRFHHSVVHYKWLACKCLVSDTYHLLSPSPIQVPPTHPKQLQLGCNWLLWVWRKKLLTTSLTNYAATTTSHVTTLDEPHDMIVDATLGQIDQLMLPTSLDDDLGRVGDDDLGRVGDGVDSPDMKEIGPIVGRERWSTANVVAWATNWGTKRSCYAT